MSPGAAIPVQLQKRWEIRAPHGQVYSRLYELVGS